MAKERIVGIDLGTTNSCLAYMGVDPATGKYGPIVLETKNNKRTMPSVVLYMYDNQNQRTVGEQAQRQATLYPGNCIYASKRFIGRTYSEALNYMGDHVKQLTYKVVKGEKDAAAFEIKKRITEGNITRDVTEIVTPERVAACILQELKRAYDETFSNEPGVKKAVITVPAYFDHNERMATKAAGQIAGLNVERIINEPTAAALSYNIKEGNILVFDLGGGTFDVSLLRKHSGGGEFINEGMFEVIGSGGDKFLGGEDFDARIIAHIREHILRTYNFDIERHLTPDMELIAKFRIRETAEAVKRDLSSSNVATVSIPFLAVDHNNQPLNVSFSITRDQYVSMTNDLVSASIEECRKTLNRAGFKPEHIDHVLFVGGMTRTPKIRKEVETLFDRKISAVINPDECVAMGAAVLGGIIAGDITDIVLTDINPVPLGIETTGGLMTEIIGANVKIPVKRSQIFTTAEDGQRMVNIHVCQGFRARAADNKSLGIFQLNDIQIARRGEPQIEVTFDMDTNGIIKVTATDKVTNKTNNITITSSNLDAEEIERLRKEEAVNAHNDKLHREKGEIIINFRNHLYYLGEELKKGKDNNTSPEILQEVESFKNQYEEVFKEFEKDNVPLNDEKLAELKSKYDEFQTKLFELAKKLNPGQNNPGGNTAGG